MGTHRSFRIEQSRILQKLDRFVVRRHVSGTLAPVDLALHARLLFRAQSGDVSPVDPAGVWALELGQQSDVLVVGMKVHFAEDALLLVALERIGDVDGLVAGVVRRR